MSFITIENQCKSFMQNSPHFSSPEKRPLQSGTHEITPNYNLHRALLIELKGLPSDNYSADGPKIS